MATRSCYDDRQRQKYWPYLEWAPYTVQATSDNGQPLEMAPHFKRWYEGVGFVDVHEEVFKLPMNTWPRDKDLKHVGMMMEENWMLGLNAFSMAFFTRVLGWNKNEIEVRRNDS